MRRQREPARAYEAAEIAAIRGYRAARRAYDSAQRPYARAVESLRRAMLPMTPARYAAVRRALARTSGAPGAPGSDRAHVHSTMRTVEEREAAAALVRKETAAAVEEAANGLAEAARTLLRAVGGDPVADWDRGEVRVHARLRARQESTVDGPA